MTRVNEASLRFTCHLHVYPQVELAMPLLPSRRASPHFGWYSFPVPLTVGGWVGLGWWLHTEVVCPSEDGHPSQCYIRARRGVTSLMHSYAVTTRLNGHHGEWKGAIDFVFVALPDANRFSNRPTRCYTIPCEILSSETSDNLKQAIVINDISQGNVIFSDHFTTKLLLSVYVKQFWISVSILWTYGHFCLTMYICCVIMMSLRIAIELQLQWRRCTNLRIERSQVPLWHLRQWRDVASIWSVLKKNILAENS